MIGSQSNLVRTISNCWNGCNSSIYHWFRHIAKWIAEAMEMSQALRLILNEVSWSIIQPSLCIRCGTCHSASGELFIRTEQLVQRKSRKKNIHKRISKSPIWTMHISIFTISIRDQFPSAFIIQSQKKKKRLNVNFRLTFKQLLERSRWNSMKSFSVIKFIQGPLKWT